MRIFLKPLERASDTPADTLARLAYPSSIGYEQVIWTHVVFVIFYTNYLPLKITFGACGDTTFISMYIELLPVTELFLFDFEFSTAKFTTY